MSKASLSHEEIMAKFMKDDEFRTEYEKLRPHYQLIAELINERHRQNMTQEEMAQRMGTKKSNISRFESGSYNPSLEFLVRAAESLGKKLSVSLV